MLPTPKKNPTNTKYLELRKLYDQFTSCLTINSKDKGHILLKENRFMAQLRLLESFFSGMENGKHHFTTLKARQLGITTESLAFDLFMLASHPGMQGALITDTEGNKEKFRVLINGYLENLPRELKIRYDTSNRGMLVLSNGSVLDYLVAGTRSKGGGLGRSRAYNLVHGTECSSWGDEKGVASLMAALSDEHPDRFYHFESTALGFNLFYNMWESSCKDHETQVPIFIGWWAKETYRAKIGSDIYKKYWESNPDLDEEDLERATICESKYGIKISPEQWAWYRWKRDTRMQSEGTMESEYPTHELEAFVATGKGFFPVKQLSNDLMRIRNEPHLNPVKLLGYKMSDEFWKTEVVDCEDWSKGELKIYEYPSNHGIYAFGVDPAYGRDENNDRSVIEILRCYADKCVQVAEYATPLVETHHLAWVLCHLAGMYRDCRINLELTGPGYAVMQEMEHLKMMLRNGYLDRQFISGAGMKDFMPNARWYLYHRPDSMGAGYVYNWKTSGENKQTIFNQTRDLYMTKQLELKSTALIEEMITLVQDGFEICGSGSNHDDRPMAIALAVKAYIEWIRQPMINQKMTQEFVAKVEEKEKKPYLGIVRSIYDDWIKKQDRVRKENAVTDSWDDEEVGMDVSYSSNFDDNEDLYE